MKRRIISILAALALCLSLCPVTAFAAGEEVVNNPVLDVSKGRIYLRDNGKGLVYAQVAKNYSLDSDEKPYTGTVTITGTSRDNGYASIWVSQGTVDIILDNVNLTALGDKSSGFPGLYVGTADDADVTLTLKGNNKLRGSYNRTNTNRGQPGIMIGGAFQNSLTIQGTGSLEAIGGNTLTTLSGRGGSGISLGRGSLEIKEGATVKATGGNVGVTTGADRGLAIDCSEETSITVDNSRLNLDGEVAIFGTGSLTLRGPNTTMDYTAAWKQANTDLFCELDPGGDYYGVLTAGGSKQKIEVGSDVNLKFTGDGSFAFSNQKYGLTVQDGGTGSSGGGSYIPETAVSVKAGTKEKKVFHEWQKVSGEGSFGDAAQENTTFTTGFGDTVIQPVYDDLYSVTVNYGTLRNTTETMFLPGTDVTIRADDRTSEMWRFDHWEVKSGGGTLRNPNAAETTFTVGSGDAVVEAVYIPLYALTVVNGSGSGSYAAGERVSIRAELPSGGTFSSWVLTSGAGTIENIASPATSFTMGAGNATVSAQYQVTASTGDFVVTGGSYGIDYTFDNNSQCLKFTGSGAYTVTMKEGVASTGNWIQVNSGSPTIVLRDVHIIAKRTSTKNNYPALQITTGAGAVTLQLDGDNTMTYIPPSSLSNGTPFEKWNTAELKITSAQGDGSTYGSLTATTEDSGSAAIGGKGSNTGNHVSNITIAGGTVTAISGGYSGIGSGYYQTAENIRITDGKVTASSSNSNGYGIGLSCGVTVSGGEVTLSGRKAAVSGTITVENPDSATIQQGSDASSLTLVSDADELNTNPQRYVTIQYTGNPVSAVSVSPNPAQVYTGGTQRFTATVTGGTDRSVRWSLEGGNSPNTTLGQDGLLSVAPDETADQLTVTATSTVDESKSGSAVVTVQKIAVSLAAGNTRPSEGEDVVLTVTLPSGVNGKVMIYRNGAPISGELTPTGSSLTYTVSHLLLNADTENRLTARFYGDSFAVESNVVTVNLSSAPSAPTGLTWQGGAASWTAADGADHYLVQLYQDGTPWAKRFP